MKRFAWIVALVFACSTAWAAKSVSPELILMHINPIKTLESSGDELYFDITEYPSSGKASHMRIPEYPLHWPSRHVKKLKEVSLWHKTLAPEQAVTLIVSLVEQDTPPWNTDDLIGTVRLHVKNVEGRLEYSWSTPNRADAPVSVQSRYGTAQKFQLLGEGGNYELFLRMGKFKAKKK